MGHNSLEGWGWWGCLPVGGELESGFTERSKLSMVTVQPVDLGGRAWLVWG